MKHASILSDINDLILEYGKIPHESKDIAGIERKMAKLAVLSFRYANEIGELKQNIHQCDAIYKKEFAKATEKYNFTNSAEKTRLKAENDVKEYAESLEIAKGDFYRHYYNLNQINKVIEAMSGDIATLRVEMSNSSKQ